MFKNLSKVCNIIWPLADFLYLLQLEEYETPRYFKRLKRFFWRRNFQVRDHLKWTDRVKITFYLILLPSLLIPPLTPIWVGLVNSLLEPAFNLMKTNAQKRAANYFAKLGNQIKVIAIAGSFGKTTTKNFIYELIKYNYKTQMIPGNINTPIGIANWILTKFDPSSQILIVEVDTYFIGEIKQSLAITPSDISVLTNIADQHLERFGSKQNLATALKEVFKYAKPNAIHIQNKRSNLEYALEVAQVLNIPQDIIDDTIKKLTPPNRRRNLIKVNDFDVIDDSYNISETTAKSGIEYAKELAKKSQKSLAVITGGIPELGKENKAGNIHLGQFLDKSADRIILLRTIFNPEIKKGIKYSDKIIEASSMPDAKTKLTDLDPKKWLVLMQPELNDLYF